MMQGSPTASVAWTRERTEVSGAGLTQGSGTSNRRHNKCKRMEPHTASIWQRSARVSFVQIVSFVWSEARRAAGGDGGRRLARNHGHGEVPGGDRVHDAHRVLDHHELLVAARRLRAPRERDETVSLGRLLDGG